MKGERRYSKEPGVKLCECECSRFLPCPANDNSPCKAAYKAQLKSIKEQREKGK
jgi:hypothetical protein